MEPTNCPRCGKLFMKLRDPVCASCMKDDEENFETVRAFVKEFPNRTIKEVSDECNVSVKRILQYIRDGRLEASSGIQSEVTCSKCGKQILSGRMCELCVKEVGSQIGSMAQEAKTKPGEQKKAANVYHIGKK